MSIIIRYEKQEEFYDRFIQVQGKRGAVLVFADFEYADKIALEIALLLDGIEDLDCHSVAADRLPPAWREERERADQWEKNCQDAEAKVEELTRKLRQTTEACYRSKNIPSWLR